MVKLFNKARKISHEVTEVQCLTLIRCVLLSPAPYHTPSWFSGSHALTTPKTLEDLVSMLWMKQLHVLREPAEDKI